MSVPETLEPLVVIFGVSALVILLLHRFKIPSIAGFLIAGVILGPHGFALVNDIHSVEVLAEIGVILLLFTIGLEFSISDFIKAKGTIVAGALQVLGTIVVVALVVHFYGRPWNTAIFWGFLVALSSTAIVLKVLSDKAEVDSYHGRIMVGILIFQDICLVPMMFLIPVLSGGKLEPLELLITFGKAVAVILIVFLGGRWVVPRLLYYAVKTKSRELFLIAVVIMCLGVALITSKFGLSLAIGAFLAGLIVSESEYAHQAISEIIPFKELFIGLFFVSVGMLMNLKFTLANIQVELLLFAIILVAKTLIIALIILMQKYPLKTAVHVGLGLAQIGEFSFVMAGVGRSSNIITSDGYQIFISASVISMLAAPFLLMAAPATARMISKKSPEKTRTGVRTPVAKEISEMETGHKKHNHVIIIGFGLTGRTLTRVLKDVNISYVVLDLNIQTVREMRKKNEPIHYGDATSAEILHTLNILKAKVLVIAINAPASVRRIVEVARKENPKIYIIVRTRYVMEVDALKAAGADEVIPEEFEVSIEIFARVLHHFQIPYNSITDMVELIRQDSYQSLRGVDFKRKHLLEACTTFPCEALPEIRIETYLVTKDSSLSQTTLKDSNMRAKTGATVIAVNRKGQMVSNPGADFKIAEGDVLFLTGDMESIQRAIHFFDGFLPAHATG
jgi:CPA2 family monovalent cation:H+ antiporter-2